jgi:peroxiredoxin
VALARGETIEGLGVLAETAKREAEFQRQYADPPLYAEALYSPLGEAYLQAKSPVLAVQSFEKALDLTKNDLFALSGLVRAYSTLGQKENARQAMARLLYVTANADKGLKVVESAKATGITAEPKATTPALERNYARVPLERYGPARWEPYQAPELEVRDLDGKRVSLAAYRGKNIILVHYLGFECPHCMRQLHDIAKKKDDWQRLNTVVLAVSSASPQSNAAGVKEFGDLPLTLLSDSADHANARRFHSYDDFEDIELHSTTLIDSKGRAYWARFGGDPFSDMEFIEKQLGRMADHSLTVAAR